MIALLVALGVILFGMGVLHIWLILRSRPLPSQNWTDHRPLDLGPILTGGTMVRGTLRWHRFARDVVLGATGIEPIRADIANALRQPAPEGLAVPL